MWCARIRIFTFKAVSLHKVEMTLRLHLAGATGPWDVSEDVRRELGRFHSLDLYEEQFLIIKMEKICRCKFMMQE